MEGSPQESPPQVFTLQIGVPPDVVSAGWSEAQWVAFLSLQATAAIETRVGQMFARLEV